MASVDINVLKQNILDFAYQQLTSLYPDFSQFIIKYNLDEISEDGSEAIGAFELLIKDNIFTIPIIYRNGNVDAISYIGMDNTGRYYALTKKLYNKLVNQVSDVIGAVIDKQKEIPLDKGLIGFLFATPNTFSPKVANVNKNAWLVDVEEVFDAFKRAKVSSLRKMAALENSLIADMAFMDSSFADSVITAVKKDPHFSKIAAQLLDLNEIEKYSSLNKIDKTASVNPEVIVYTSLDDINHLSKEEKREAFTKIATKGFYIKRNNVLNKVASMQIDDISSIINTTELVEIDDCGFYTVFDKNFNPVDIVAVRRLEHMFGGKDEIGYKNRNSLKGLYFIKDKKELIQADKSNVIGIKQTATLNISLSIKKNLQPFNPNEDGILVFVMDDSNIFYMDYMAEYITKSGNNYFINLDAYVFRTIKSNISSIVVTKDTNRPVIKNNILYLPSDHVYSITNHVYKDNAEKMFITKDMLKERLLDVAGERHSLSYREDGKIVLDGKILSAPSAVIKLAQLGLDEENIDTLIKTAAKTPDVEQYFYRLEDRINNILTQLQNQQISIQQLFAQLQNIQQEVDETKQTTFSLAQLIAGLQAQQPASDDQTNMVQDPQQILDSQADVSQQSDVDEQDIISQIQQLAPMIGIDPNELIQKAKAGGYSLEDVLLRLKNQIALLQEQQAQQPASDNQAVMMEQQAQQPASDNQAVMMEQQAQQPTSDNQAAMMEQQGQGDERQHIQTDDNGMLLQNLTPEMLSVLKELADKRILETTLISYLTNLNTPSLAVKQYLEDIRDGINGLVRVLMIVDINYNKILDDVSEGVISNFLSKGKSLAQKMTDFIIDVETM